MIKPPVEPDDLLSFAKSVAVTANRAPIAFFNLDDNLGYHASRLSLLIHRVGNVNKQSGIHGRTKLAKLDFLVRYPNFLARAIEIAGSSELQATSRQQLEPMVAIESKMVRYRYGPWDHRYYTVLAYMLGKRLIMIKVEKGVDNFLLQDNGNILVQNLENHESWQEVIVRCELAGRLFGNRSGSYVKDFIYRHFPEVVHTPYSYPLQIDW